MIVLYENVLLIEAVANSNRAEIFGSAEHEEKFLSKHNDVSLRLDSTQELH